MVSFSPFFFFWLLPATLTIHWLLPPRLRGLLLVLVSLALYLYADHAAFPLLILAICVNYLLGLLLARRSTGAPPPPRGRRSVLLLAVGFNLGLLLYGKYGAFLLSSVTLGAVQIGTRHVPLGISFITFGLLAYLLDIYHGRTAAERSPLRFALYVSLFPKVVAGPIARYRDLAAQLHRPDATLERFAEGARRFLLGLGKKVLIANAVAPVADEIFGLPHGALTPGLAWLGAFCYGVQIYFDFSGYSDMAIGLGRMLGYDIPENFNYPYIAKSIREFWQRWHITLSTWFRDYVFLPLAYGLSRRLPQERVLGARAEIWAYAAATLTTMFLCGLWHGASWTFALWGLWHGLFMVLENTRAGKRAARRLGSPLRLALAQVIVLIGWVIFRAQSTAQIAQFLTTMAGFGGGGHGVVETVAATDLLSRHVVGALLLGVLFSAPVPSLLRSWRARALETLPAHRVPVAQTVIACGMTGFLLALMALCVMSLASGTYNPFVYRQF